MSYRYSSGHAPVRLDTVAPHFARMQEAAIVLSVVQAARPYARVSTLKREAVQKLGARHAERAWDTLTSAGVVEICTGPLQADAVRGVNAHRWPALRREMLRTKATR